MRINESLPKDWNLVSISQIANINVSSLKNDINKDYKFYYIDLSSVKQGSIDFPNEMIKYSDSPSRARRIIKKEDVIMATVRPNLFGFAYVNFEAENFICSTGFAIISHKKISNGNFIYQSLYSRNVQSQINKLIVGSNYPAINSSDVQNIKIPLPPLPEQQKIAEILSTVDDKIEIIDQQITETQELKKGLMQRLLTKGIEHTEFKDSPLGEIPKSWEVVKLEGIANCFVGIASSATHAYRDEGILLIRNQNIKEGRLDISDVLYVTEEYELQHKSKRLKEGDILTVRTGYPGISAVVPRELEGTQSFTTLITRRNNDDLSSEFLCYYINSEIGKSFFNSNKAGGGQKNVGSKTLGTMKIPIPTKEEQSKIVNILKVVDEKLATLSEKKQTYQELKKGLMQQLLTGLVRVKV